MRVRKNSGNFISNGPIILVWVTHGKVELEGLIRKLFTVKSRAIGHYEGIVKMPLIIKRKTIFFCNLRKLIREE